MPKKANKKYVKSFGRSLFALFVIFFLIGNITKAGWAALSLVKPDDAAHEVTAGSRTEIPADFPETSKSQAPEPTTLALFGSGIMGMGIRFVRRSYQITKRIIDTILSILALLVLSPLCLFAALLIKLASKGPIFFSQTRVGKNGTLFEIYKFRTMTVDAEKETGPIWAKSNDNRLIPCGQFLRKTHIDEIPQFINVIKGDMSIVGPRPERPVFVDQFKKVISDYEKRIAVKPGITGLAQVWHKYDESMADVRKKIKYDLLYIKKLCLWTDVTILLRTVRVVFTGEGAR